MVITGKMSVILFGRCWGEDSCVLACTELKVKSCSLPGKVRMLVILLGRTIILFDKSELEVSHTIC